jgi:hypothetical protein
VGVALCGAGFEKRKTPLEVCDIEVLALVDGGGTVGGDDALEV